jgi:tetratricopeptide (TPR) repeat protein
MTVYLKKEAELSEHLTPMELQAGSRSAISSQRRQEILFHLLQGCPACRAAVGWNRRVRESLGVSEELLARREATYDQPVARSFEQAIRLKRVLEEQRAQARVAATVLAEGEDAREGLAALAERLEPAELGVYEALLHRISALRFDDPVERVRLARRAVEVAGSLDPATYGDRQVADFQARAWGELGNSLRAADDLWEAQHAFERAFDVLERGTGATALMARLHNLHASLLGTQRRFELAFLALDVVRDLYLEMGDTHSAGRVLVKKAVYLQYSGQPEEALQVLQKGIAWIDEVQDPTLLVIALHNHLSILVDCGRFREAKRLLFRNRRRIQRAGHVQRLRLVWVEGRVRHGLGEMASAESLLLEAKQGFEAAGMHLAAAVASLEAAMVRMRQDRIPEAEELVTEAAAVFAALGIHREALSAVRLLQEAFERRKATAVLLERTVAFLRELEKNPDAHYAFRLD